MVNGKTVVTRKLKFSTLAKDEKSKIMVGKNRKNYFFFMTENITEMHTSSICLQLGEKQGCASPKM